MPDQHVLALKWRPHNFNEMLGQEHVLPALINSLDHNRLHHAYLFTGTRGVGKTSVARILAKCLNCEVGISSTPCNTCNTCQAVDAGHFIDLIEVDAASRTKVEDTRELLDNVQYTPTQGRFKIYLIDEVHMLSGHSFNALLKTLEEPPPHVKFLLATTDPQRLPVTVLSRCLQFNLKHLSCAQLTAHFAAILEKENITADSEALTLLADAAKGSVRDGLSLLDQAIAYCQNHLALDKVRTILGCIGQDYIDQIIQALENQEAQSLLNIIAKIAEYTPNFSQVLEDLLSTLHAIAVAQFVPEAPTRKAISAFAKTLSKETVQLYYQIALIGRRDLSLAHSPRAGIEMVLLRMLAFQPAPTKTIKQDLTKTPIPKLKTPPENLTKNWTNIVNQLNLSGMGLALASHCTVKAFDGITLTLLLSAKHQPILSKKLEERLNTAISTYLDKPVRLQISIGESNTETPAKQQQQQKEMALKKASDNIKNDVHVQQLMKTFDAEIEKGSIQAQKNSAEKVN